MCGVCLNSFCSEREREWTKKNVLFIDDAFSFSHSSLYSTSNPYSISFSFNNPKTTVKLILWLFSILFYCFVSRTEIHDCDVVCSEHFIQFSGTFFYFLYILVSILTCTVCYAHLLFSLTLVSVTENRKEKDIRMNSCLILTHVPFK